MNDFSTRLKQAAKQLSQADVARGADLPKQSVSAYFNGQMPNGLALIQLARFLRVDPTWLATGMGISPDDLALAKGVDPELVEQVLAQLRGTANGTTSESADSSISLPPEIVLISRFNVELRAGAGDWQERAARLDGLAFSRDYLAKLGASNGQGLIVLDVRGDSMVPTICDGAAVLVDTRDHAITDGIWAFAFGDALRIKRLRRGLTKLTIISDNPTYPPEEIGEHEESQLNLIGRVRWVGQTL